MKCHEGQAQWLRTPVPRSFYLHDPLWLAVRLLGSTLCSCIEGQLTCGRIVETEGYWGPFDRASHTYGGRPTPATQVQYGPGGHAYVFLIYGMYAMFCVVAGSENMPGAVLVRALEPVEGIEVMRRRRGSSDPRSLTNGPGKLCRALAITRQDNGEDLGADRIWIAPSDRKPAQEEIVAARRVGVEYAKEWAARLWRFYRPTSVYVSRRDPDAVALLDAASRDDLLAASLQQS